MHFSAFFGQSEWISMKQYTVITRIWNCLAIFFYHTLWFQRFWQGDFNEKIGSFFCFLKLYCHLLSTWDSWTLLAGKFYSRNSDLKLFEFQIWTWNVSWNCTKLHHFLSTRVLWTSRNKKKIMNRPSVSKAQMCLVLD